MKFKRVDYQYSLFKEVEMRLSLKPYLKKIITEDRVKRGNVAFKKGDWREMRDILSDMIDGLDNLEKRITNKRK